MLKNWIIKICMIVGIVVLDLVTKIIFLGTNFTIIPYLISTRPAPLNTGGAWGIFGEHTWFLVLFTILFLVFVCFFEYRFKNKTRLYSISLSFIVGGAVGNLIDRIALGGVRDFISFEFWQSFPTFNLADSFLCIGLLLLVIFVIFFYNPNKASQNIANQVDEKLQHAKQSEKIFNDCYKQTKQRRQQSQKEDVELNNQKDKQVSTATTATKQKSQLKEKNTKSKESNQPAIKK